MTREEKAAQAKALRDQGLLLREIAEEMGVAFQTVHAWLSDPDGSKLRARKDSYRGKCVDCGAPTYGGDGPNNRAIRCNDCNFQHKHDSRRWTPDAVVEAIRLFNTMYGRPPGVTDFVGGHKCRITATQRERYASRLFPPVSTVLRECGSWNEALRLAGFEPTREFNRPYAADPTVVDRAAEAYRDGYTLEEVGAMFGVSGSRIMQWLKAAGVSRRTPAESVRLHRQREAEQVAA